MSKNKNVNKQKEISKLTLEYFDTIRNKYHVPIIIMFPDAKEGGRTGTRITYQADYDEILNSIINLTDYLFLNTDLEIGEIRDFQHAIDDLCEDRKNANLAAMYDYEHIMNMMDDDDPDEHDYDDDNDFDVDYDDEEDDSDDELPDNPMRS